MSKVAEELTKLIREKEELRKNISDFTEVIKNLEKDRKEFEEKLKALKTKKSGLAKDIIKTVEIRLRDINYEIRGKEQVKAKWEVSLSEVENKISERKEDTTLYIQEQCERMFNSFMEHIRLNAEDIGYEIKKVFVISTISKKEEDRYGSFYIPTGNIGIYDDNKEEPPIVQSEGFYFKNNLYTLERDSYDAVTCTCTEWYNEYFKKFVSILLKTFEEKFDSCDFKLTINKPKKTFTLELV